MPGESCAPCREGSLGIEPAKFHLPRPEVAGLVTRPMADEAPFRDARIDLDCGLYGPVSPSTVAVYRLRALGHEQVGLVAEVAVADYDTGRIRPHETTRERIVDSLVEHIGRNQLDVCPVALAHDPDEELAAIIGRLVEAPWTLQVVTEDDTEHTVWLLDPHDAAPLRDRLARHPSLYLVDGHHRSAAWSRLAASAPPSDTNGSQHQLFAWMVARDQLRVASHHVIVRAPGVGPGEIVRATERCLGTAAEATSRSSITRTAQGTISLWCAGRWYRFVTPGSASIDDASLLQSAVLGPVFGVDDPGEDDRLEHLPGTVAPGQLESRCPDGAVAFVLHPPAVDSLFDAADAGRCVPPKSSFFHPKLATGLFVRDRR